MAQLSDVQIAELVRGAGFRLDVQWNPASRRWDPRPETGLDPEKISASIPLTPVGIATAIALAESGGRTDARKTNHDRWNSVDRGLFQFNSHHHPEVTDAAADDPEKATLHALRVSSQGTNFDPWNTWTDPTVLGRGRGKEWPVFADRVLRAVMGTLETPPITDLGSLGKLPNPLAPVEAVARLGAKILGVLLNPELWRRLGLVLAGVGLFALGAYILVKGQIVP